MKILPPLTIVMALTLIGCSDYFASPPRSSGQVIFRTLTMGGCARCHKTTSRKFVGPGMAGVSKIHSDEWMRKWLKDPQKVWEDNDPETLEMKKRLGREKKLKTAMKMPKNLSDADIEELIKYLKTL